MITVIFALLLMGGTASVASFFLKKSTTNGLSVKSILFSKYFYLGGFLYVSAALLNIYLLKILPYSVVVPLGALTYVWTMLISNKWLGEKITRKKLCGVSFILIGVCLLTAVK